MEQYIVNFIKCESHGGLIAKKHIANEPKCGDIIFINGYHYYIIDTRYDYEVWQSTGVKVFDAIVTSISEDSFEYEFHLADNKISILGIKGKCPKEIFIPTYINVGNKMQTVSHALLINLSCEIIHFPGTIKEIDMIDEESIKEVFMNDCNNLEDFTFENCINLRKVHLPNGLSEIPPFAFRGCVNLSEVVTNNSNLIFYNNTFTNCKNIKSNLSSFISDFKIENGLLFNKLKTEVYTFLGCDDKRCLDIVLPSSVTHIGNGFGYSEILSIDLSQTSIKEIGNDTFKNCHNLRKVILPKILTRVGERAFSGCEHLCEIELPNSLKELSIACFSECGLKKIIIPKSLEGIPKTAFLDCKNLEYVDIPRSVKSINTSAFRGCKAINHVCISIGYKNNISKFFENTKNIQFNYYVETTNSFTRRNGAYTYGELICPYCDSKNIQTYCDGTAKCNSCLGEFTYYKP